MTEAEWNACTDPQPMLEFLRGKASNRKVRLFAVACCRRNWHLLAEQSRMTVAIEESKVDGRMLQSESAATIYDPHAPRDSTLFLTTPDAWSAAHNCSSDAGWDAARRESDPLAAGDTERMAHACLLHDLFGPLPFRSVTLASASRTTAAVSLAEVIYNDRAFDRLPILADALEDAGCHDADILAHCRGPGPHVRGCWVVDLLLERA